MLPWIGFGMTGSARLARETSLFGAGLWRADETKKARSSLLQATSPVESGVRRFSLRLPVVVGLGVSTRIAALGLPPVRHQS
jgi:hypothetical protein